METHPHPLETRPHNFLGLDPPYSEYARARFVVLPIPYDATTSYRPGARFGPAAIIEASEQLEFYDADLGGTFHECGIATLDALAPNVAGPQAMHEDVCAFARPAVADGKFPLALGGEHGITSGLVRAVAERHPHLSVLQIDAHADLREAYEGSAYSHAAVMRRVREYAPTIVPVGIRSYSAEEHAFMGQAGIEPLTAGRCHRTTDWMAAAVERLGAEVYVTIDIDGFDPAYAPGTGTPEPGGLNWSQVVELLARVTRARTVVGADVVEVAPVPGQNVTEYLAARLVYKLIALVQVGDEGA